MGDMKSPEKEPIVGYVLVDELNPDLAKVKQIMAALDRTMEGILTEGHTPVDVFAAANTFHMKAITMLVNVTAAADLWWVLAPDTFAAHCERELARWQAAKQPMAPRRPRPEGPRQRRNRP